MVKFSQLIPRFQHPAPEDRPIQIIHQNFPSPDGHADFFADARAKGMGGFVVNMDRRVPHAEGLDDYLRDKYEWKRLQDFVNAAFENSFEVWLYDEKGFPSGAAGDILITENPERQVKCLSYQVRDIWGGIGSAGTEDGRVIYAAILPAGESGPKVIPDIRDKAVFWDLKPGKYRLEILIAKKAEYYTMHKVPFVDLLDPEVGNTFVDVTHKRYLENLGEDTFARIGAIFTDEPGFAVHGCSFHFHEKYPVVPWSRSIEEALFTGDDALKAEDLVSLFDDRSPFDRKIRIRFWQSVTNGFINAFFRPIASFCDKKGTAMTGHLYGEENLAMQTGLNGTLFALMCEMQIPGVDRLYCTGRGPVIPEKTASSAAHIMGRKYVMSESSAHFEAEGERDTGYDVSDMINSGLDQLVLGVNRIASYFRYDMPADERKRYEETIGAVAAMVTQGVHISSFLIHIPTELGWSLYRPVAEKNWPRIFDTMYSEKQPDGMRYLEKEFAELTEGLLDDQWDYDLIDTKRLEGCEIRDGRVFTGNESYDAVIFLDIDDQPMNVRDMINGLRAKKVLCLEGRGFLKKNGTSFFTKDLSLDVPNTGIRFRHNRVEDADIYLIHNRTGDIIETDLSIRDNGSSGSVIVLDPMCSPKTVKERPERISAEGRVRIHLALPAKSARIIVI